MLDKSLTDATEAHAMPIDETIGKKGTKERPFFAKFLRAIVQFALMVGVLGGAFFIMQNMISGRDEPRKRTFNRQSFTVEAEALMRADHRPTILVYGKVETARNIDLKPLVSGEITNVNPSLSAGARIEKGEFLIEIDRFDYEGAILEAKANLAQTEGAIKEIDAKLASERDQLTATEEQLELAKADLKRAQSLADSGTLTNKDVEQRVLLVSQRTQSVSQRTNNIAIYETQKEQQIANASRLAWKLDEAERRLEETKLYAPFGGIISSSNAEPGQSVNTSDVIASVYDDMALEATFTLTNAQFGRMSADGDPLIGRQVEVIWTVGNFDYRYSAQIDRIGATVAADRGGVEVVATIDPAEHAVQLRPGAFVEIIVPEKLYKDSFEVPETSIYDQSSVFVIVDGQLVRREVNVLAYDGSHAIVSSKDGAKKLNDGDQLLTTRLTQADDGVNVRAPGKRQPRGDGTPEARKGQGGVPNANNQNDGQAGTKNGKRAQSPNKPRTATRAPGG